MDEPTCLNFDLRIEPWNGGYRARVVESPVDRGAVHEFSLSPAMLDPGRWADGQGSRAFGEQLFKTVFDDDRLVVDLWRRGAGQVPVTLKTPRSKDRRDWSNLQDWTSLFISGCALGIMMTLGRG